MRPGISQQSRISFVMINDLCAPGIPNHKPIMMHEFTGFESFQRQACSHGMRIGSLARGTLRSAS